MAQWERISLPGQGTRVCSLGWEDPTCHRASKLGRHHYGAGALEPGATATGPGAPTIEAPNPRAQDPQEKPLQREACGAQLESSPRSLQLEQSLHISEDPAQPPTPKYM